MFVNTLMHLQQRLDSIRLILSLTEPEEKSGGLDELEKTEKAVDFEGKKVGY
jgi:hypothetical protein